VQNDVAFFGEGPWEKTSIMEQIQSSKDSFNVNNLIMLMGRG